MKEAENGKSQQYHAFKLLKFILDHLRWSEEVEILRINSEVPGLLFVAADLGNTEFLIAIINYNPDLTWRIDTDNLSIFHVAVLHRHQNIFNLLKEIGFGSLIATYRDRDDNNMLHLAAKLAPQEQLNNISGAALQMQRELLWYKVNVMLEINFFL